MATQQDESAGAPETGIWDVTVRAAGAAVEALGHLAGGLGSAVLALAVLVLLAVTAVTGLVGVGLLLASFALRALHAVAGRERDRLTHWGPEIAAPDPPPTRLRLAIADRTTRRELRWPAGHATLGLLLGLIGVLLPLFAARDTTFPLWWRLVPKGANSTSLGLGTANDWLDALAAALLGLGWIAIIVGLTPGMAQVQARRAGDSFRQAPKRISRCGSRS